MTSYFERARLLYDQRRYELAIQQLQQALSINPDDSSSHSLLALCLAQQQKYAGAIDEIDQAIRLSPNYAGYHYIKAGILQDQGNLKNARDAIAEALRLDPEDAENYRRLAAIQYGQNQIKVALASAEQGLQLNAEHIGCMNLRILALTQLGQLAKAEADIQTVLSTAPDNYFAHAAYGWICLRRGRIPDALDGFRSALRLQPDLEWARLGLMEALKARNGFYRFIFSVDQWRSRMVLGKGGFILLIPHIKGIYYLIVFIVFLNKVIFTFLLSLDAYGKLTLTPTEIRKNRWLMARLATAILGILLLCLFLI